MSDQLHFEIVSPERQLKDASAALIVLPGIDGDFGVLADHAPTMSTLRPGVIEIFEREGGSAEQLFVKGGLAQVSDAGLTILAEEVIELNSVNREELETQIANANEDLADANDEVEAQRIQRELAWMTALNEVAM